METNQENYQEKELLELAKKKIEKIKNLYIHLGIFALGILFFILKTYFGFSLNLFPICYLNYFTMAIWTFTIVVQSLEVFMSEVVFGKKWENRKVKRMLVKKNEKQIWK